MTPYLFVYASLRNGFHSPAYAYITQFFKSTGNAFVKGKFFFNGQVPVAIASDEDIIEGELYELKDIQNFNWAICQLDDYEGLNVEEGEVPLYKREIVTVIHNNVPANAWIYWYNRSTTGMPVIPSSDISNLLQQLKKAD